MEPTPDQSRDEAERRRLVTDAEVEPPAGTMTDVLTVRAHDVAPSAVIERTREVLLIVTSQTRDRWPTLDAWRRVLPAWFVSRCASEQTSEEAARSIARWGSLSWDEKQRELIAENPKPWMLSAWLHFFRPGDASEREWRWWSARALDAHTAEVRVEVLGWPYARGALEWLLRAAGAISVHTGSDG